MVPGDSLKACDKVLTALNFKVVQKKVDIFQVVSELNSLGKAVAEVETIKLRLGVWFSTIGSWINH